MCAAWHSLGLYAVCLSSPSIRAEAETFDASLVLSGDRMAKHKMRLRISSLHTDDVNRMGAINTK